MPTAPATDRAGEPHVRGLPHGDVPDRDLPERDLPERDLPKREFPILDEVPELDEALGLAREIDRLVARLLSGLLHLTEHDLAEVQTGVAIDQWLALAAGRTHADRRMLLSACDVLRRLPTLREAFLTHAAVSWAQVRAVVLRVVRLPQRLDDVVDHAIGELLLAADAHTDPDDLVRAVSIAVSSVEAGAEASPARRHEPQEFLALQPRLDGTGGQVFGEFGAVSFAALDAALAPEPEALTSDAADHGTEAEPPEPAPRRGREGRWDPAGVGRARAARLIELLTGPATDHGRRGRAAGRPQLLVRMDLTTLLDRDQLPAELLTTLTGGHMWADATTIRRLVAERGADLRGIVLDGTGAVLGVGRRTRVPPDWLADAILARHTTCSHPGCRTAARVCDLDHARGWWPADRDQPGGTTDAANLAPLCARHNRSREREGWQAQQSADGSRSWRHPRTGLTADTLAGTLPPATQQTLLRSAGRTRPPP